jgi:hypothetical protein
MKRTYFLISLLALVLVLAYNGCQHDADDIVEPGPDTTGCDTSGITYTGSVYPILQENCFACHGGPDPAGKWDFTVYDNVATLAADGRLLNAIKHLTPDPFYWMPQGLPMLDSCKILTIEIWVRDTTFTLPPDPTHPRDPDTVYFESDVLPILRASCAKPPHAAMQCHDDNAEEDVRLDSYAAVMASDVITPFDPEESELYKKITETDEEKRMPPSAAGDPALSSEQIAIIQKWITQGAVTWAEGNFKMPKSSNPTQLPECNIDQIRIWIEAGTPDN